MSTYLIPIAVTAIIGSALVTGLLFAFSNFMMRALADMPSDQGMFAMQRINERIINPIFLLLFFGTSIASGVIVLLTLGSINTPGYVWLMAGAIFYVLGPLGITVFRNVPLNNALAKCTPSEAEAIWPEYRTAWQFWNHIRSYIGVVSIGCMAIGMADLNR